MVRKYNQCFNTKTFFFKVKYIIIFIICFLYRYLLLIYIRYVSVHVSMFKIS